MSIGRIVFLAGLCIVAIAPGAHGQPSRVLAVLDSTKEEDTGFSESGPTDDRTPPPVRSNAEEPFLRPLPLDDRPFDYTKIKTESYNLEVIRAEASIQLDGRLTETDWQRAGVAKNFYQLEPAEGNPASQPTEVRVLYDNENLYIGVICFDAEPNRIMAPDMQRDARLNFSNDTFSVVISSLDGFREAYEFQTNPNGARFDSFASKEGNSTDRDWNG
ncbi:MAG: carbohydrate binding family 9 domain-containing protein, partial [candidate division Zixibacteria bacterium]|nr:carbohydrate binding family 9 domain-containing protein [candidate division Zixibacteria bacterium]